MLSPYKPFYLKHMFNLLNSVLKKCNDCRLLMSAITDEVEMLVPALLDQFGPIIRTEGEEPFPTFINNERSTFAGCHFHKVETRGENEKETVLITVTDDITGTPVSFPYPHATFHDDAGLLKFILSHLSDEQKESIKGMPSPIEKAKGQ